MSKVEQSQAVDIAGWKKAATHYPLLPSNSRVGIRIPDLNAMIEAGQIPQHLLSAALGVAQAGADVDGSEVPTVESMTKNAAEEREFTDLMVKKAVVEPAITDADLPEIPTEDKQFIVAVATRQRDLDVEGEHIAGLTASEKFRRFRGLGEFDETLEGA
jgi:hypothetical protein